MRFSLEYLSKRLYVIRDRFFQVYISDVEVQSKKTYALIIKFRILNPENIDNVYKCRTTINFY